MAVTNTVAFSAFVSAEHAFANDALRIRQSRNVGIGDRVGLLGSRGGVDCARQDRRRALNRRCRVGAANQQRENYKTCTHFQFSLERLHAFDFRYPIDSARYARYLLLD